MSSVSRTAGAASSISIQTKNSAGQLVTPVSVPVVKWYTDTDRTLGEVTLSSSGSGSTYTTSWTAPQAPATPASRYLKVTIEVSSGVFDVDVDDDINFLDALAVIDGGLCTLAEVKAHLIKGAGTTDDAALTTWIGSVTATIEGICGPMVPRTVTDPLQYPTGSQLTLNKWPITGITSVTEYQGTTAQAYSVITTPASAGAYTVIVERDRTLRRLDGSGPAPFTGGLVVVYTAGRSPIPDAINRAAVLIVQHLWRTRLGGSTPAYGTGDDLVDDPSFGYAVPSRAMDLIQPYRQRLRIS